MASAKRELGEYEAALKAVNGGLSSGEGGNDDLRGLLKQLEPEVARIQASKRAAMSQPERLKEQANDLFKAGKFEEAIPQYTRVLDKVADKASPLAIACFNNRAACNHQLSNFAAVRSVGKA